jgi:SAM-dependent methyltransferase
MASHHHSREFADVSLDVEDLLLLDSFQISYFPGWLPERELAAILWAHPYIRRFLIHKHPPIAPYVERITAAHGPAGEPQELRACADAVIGSLVFELIYNRCPAAYDRLPFHDWDFGEVSHIVSLDDKVVIDGGAGTGRVALEAARSARQVYAIEPVSRLREFMRERAKSLGLPNVYVMDGFLHEIPLPSDFADVLITSHALGWRLADELAEFERVVRAGGHVVHCPGTPDGKDEETHGTLVSEAWDYAWSTYEEADGRKRKYWKRVSGTTSDNEGSTR